MKNRTRQTLPLHSPKPPPRAFQLQKIYVKDASFEVPGAPAIFQSEGAAEIKLNLAQRVNKIQDDLFEVVLTVTVTATSGEKTAYLAEVHQAGLFSIAGLAEAQLQAALNTLCPHSLFPYAASAITGLVATAAFRRWYCSRSTLTRFTSSACVKPRPAPGTWKFRATPERCRRTPAAAL